MLTIGLDTKSKMPLYEQIYKYIRDEIHGGNLLCGEKLPSSRKLSSHLAVSRNTVDLAYGQLLSEGYIEAKPKQGYYVAAVDEIAAFTDDIQVEDEPEPLKQSYPYDFTPSGVDMTYFPYNTWRKLMKEVLMDDNSEIFQNGDTTGDRELREAIKTYLHQSRGVRCTRNQIILGSGMEFLLLLLGQIFEKKPSVAMENPTYMQAYYVFRQMEFPICGIPVDEGGMCMDYLADSNADIAYVTPSHQYPTGIVMPVSRRNALLNWASEKKDRYIIEDDYDSEFRFQGRPIPALQGNDKNGKVIYMGTFSKAIAPAIRVAYMVLPVQLLRKYQEKISFYSCTVSRIDQAILSGFIRGGYFERHLNRMRALYKNKNQCLMQQLKAFGDSIVIQGSTSGLHLLVEFKGIEDHNQFQNALKDNGVLIQNISQYYIEGKPEKIRYILGFARLNEKQITEGISRIQMVYDKIKIRKEKECR